ERDFTGAGNGDGHGHGSHCAGTIFGRSVASERFGVAPGIRRALVGKVLGDDGRGESAWVFQAMQWALAGGAQVICLSLAFDFPPLVAQLVARGWPPDLATSSALEAFRGTLRMFDAIMSLVQARIPLDGGAVVVAAAGNESRRDVDRSYEISVSLP